MGCNNKLDNTLAHVKEICYFIFCNYTTNNKKKNTAIIKNYCRQKKIPDV